MDEGGRPQDAFGQPSRTRRLRAAAPARARAIVRGNPSEAGPPWARDAYNLTVAVLPGIFAALLAFERHHATSTTWLAVGGSVAAVVLTAVTAAYKRLTRRRAERA
jgi:hypothetical protein